MRNFLILLLLFSLSPVIADDHQNRPVLVGFDGAYSVKNATSAAGIELGIKTALHEINEAGGVLGGRQLKFIKMDNHSVPARGLSNLKKMAQMRDLVAIIGGRFSTVLLQQLPYLHELGLPMIDVWAAADGITDHDYSPSYTFRVSLKDEWAMPHMINYLRSSGHQRIGLILPSNGWGRSNERSLQKYKLQNPELDIVDIVWYSFGAQKMLDHYNKLLISGADSVILVANDFEASILVRELGENPSVKRLPIASHWGVSGGNMVESSGPTLPELDFSLIQTFSFYNLPEAKQLRFLNAAAKVSSIDSLDDIAAPVGTAHAYDAIHLLALAINKAGSTNRSHIRDALESGLEFDGLIKNYAPAFTADNHDALSPDILLMARFREDGTIFPIR